MDFYFELLTLFFIYFFYSTMKENPLVTETANQVSTIRTSSENMLSKERKTKKKMQIWKSEISRIWIFTMFHHLFNDGGQLDTTLVIETTSQSSLFAFSQDDHTEGENTKK